MPHRNPLRQVLRQAERSGGRAALRPEDRSAGALNQGSTGGIGTIGDDAGSGGGIGIVLPFGLLDLTPLESPAPGFTLA